MPTFYISWLLAQKFRNEGIFCDYPKSFVQDLSKKEKLTHTSLVSPKAVCRKAAKESTAKVKVALTKHVKRAAVALRLFSVNALENKKNLIIVKFVVNKYCL